MTIAKKILLGYGLLLILVFVHLAYSLSSLDEMERINKDIAEIDNPLHDLARQLIDTLLGQEFYSSRVLILKDRGSFDLLQKRNKDFDDYLLQMKAFSDRYAAIRTLSEKGVAFSALISKYYGTVGTILALSPKQHEMISGQRKELIDLADAIRSEVREDQIRKIRLNSAVGGGAYRVLLVFGIGSVLIAVGITLLFAMSISRSVRLLKLATQQISESRFSEVRALKSRDEFGEISRSIAEMALKIEELEKLHLATNPLTLLPGGLAIDGELKARLQAETPTALCMIDLDNFKVFNDRYGFARGNEVIQATATIIREAVKKYGGKDDFIGHIGGDDFAVITSPEKFEGMCKALTNNFDSIIPQLYDKEDRDKGAITGKTRQGMELVFPLMTVSVAVVTDQDGTIREPLIMSRRAAELKEHAKSMSGSVFVVDKRRYNDEEKQ